MPARLLRALALTTMLTAATPALAAPSPVDGFFGPILADAPDAGAITRRCDAYVAEIDRRVAELGAQRGPATIDRTLARYDDVVDLISAGSGEFSLYREVMADDARRGAGASCEVRLSAEQNKLSLSRPIYDRLKAIDAARADAATRLYLTRAIAAFERAGVNRPAAERAKIQALQDRIAALGTQFDKNIADSRRTVSADPAELAGLPQDYIDAHKPGADGKVTISTDYPDYVPVMTYAASEPLRKRIYTAYMTRAWPQNDVVLRQLLDLRQQLATMLGRKDYATLILEDKMLDTPAKVEALMSEMAAVAKPAGERDLAKKLAVLKSIDPAATALNAWTNAYVTQITQKRNFDYDQQAARQYFAYNNVRDGILKLTQDLFGVEIRPWATAKWDPLVETYEVHEGGRLIGRFYLDSHPRPGKYNHGNAVPLRNGIAGRSVPVAALVMNLPAGDHTTGLMEYNDVDTFLHEFGHLLHHIFGGQQTRWVGNRASRPNGTSSRRPRRCWRSGSMTTTR